MRRPILFALTTLVAVGAAVAVARVWLVPRQASMGPASPDALGLYGEVPDFSLTERSGRRVTRSDLLGKVWIANFIYTNCTETCPLQSAQLARLDSEFAGEEVDPERDTPAVLSRYAERYAVHPARWLFLTGDKRAIYGLAKEGFRLGVVDPGDEAHTTTSGGWLQPAAAWASHGSKGLVLHSPRLVLVDRRARIRAYHRPDESDSLERLRQNVRAVLRERGKER